MRLVRGRPVHVVGHTGGVREQAEPDSVDPRRTGVGALDGGVNLIAVPGQRLMVRGGSRVVQTFADVAGDPISDVLGGFPWSPVGCIVIAHSADALQHYAYALNADTMAFALPVLTETEAGSRATLGWATATPGRPVAVELFEKLYVADASRTARRNLAAIALSAGSLSITNPAYDIASGVGTDEIRAFTIAAYNGVLFISGYDSEVGGLEPAMMRHSFLGRDPSASDAFDADGYAIIGAKGVYVTAQAPGNSILLVAKEEELYRLTGTGKAVAGWHYGISPLDNTLGVGASNPLALCHGGGWWYGVGKAGPWRSNGQSVELLLAGRERSWSRVADLEVATVTYHPDRRRVLFGLTEAGDTKPRKFWKWDIDRTQWDVADRYPSEFHTVRAIPATIGLGVEPPTDLAQSFAFADHRFDRLTGTFTPKAVTTVEVWLRHASQASVQVATLSPGIARFTLDATALGLNFKGEVVYLKLRHLKAGVYSDFTGEVEFYPRIRAPFIALQRTNASPEPAEPRSIYVENEYNNSLVQNLHGDSSNASWSNDWADAPVGYSSDTASEPAATVTYELWVEQPAFIGHEEGDSTFVIAADAATGQPAPSAPTQFFGNGLWLDRIDVFAMPGGWASGGNTYTVQYRVTGSGSGWTNGPTYTVPSLPANGKLDLKYLSIAGLAASTQYDMRVQVNYGLGDSVSPVTVMYTKLEAPTIAVAQGGAATPDVDLTVTVPASGDGKDVRVYSASNTAGTPEYSALQAAQSAGAHVYTSTAGVCGVANTFYAAMVDSSWPTGFQHSDPASATISDPCAP